MRANIGRRPAWLVGALVAGVLGCTPTQSGTVAESVGGSDEDLVASMSVETGADGVQLTLHVTNASAAPIELEFSSGQRYDFQVTTVGEAGVPGETLWTWSADKSFMQALGSETLPPGASLRFTEEWAAGGRRGDFIGIGTLTSTNRPVRQMVRFELAGDE